jgi:hypothetical protein
LALGWLQELLDKLANEKKRDLFIEELRQATVVILAVDNKFQDSSILYNIVFF